MSNVLDKADLFDPWADEELNPELAEYLVHDEVLGPMIQHPLVYSVPHNDAFNRRANLSLKYKKQAAEGALLAKNFSKYITLHERPYRLQAFFDIRHDIDGAQYWQMLREIYDDSENIHQNYDAWFALLNNNEAKRVNMMTKAEFSALQTMDRKLTVYRGYRHPDAINGFSWTTDRKVAEFFAKRFLRPGQTGYVATGTIKKSRVIAYLQNRNESEIVTLPHIVDVTDVEELLTEPQSH